MMHDLFVRRFWDLEPETKATVDLMIGQPPSDARILLYDSFIKDLKRANGLKLNAFSLVRLFSLVYVRAAHSKEAALLNWVQNAFHGIEIGTIRYIPEYGVGGNTGSYINNLFIPAIDAGNTSWTYRVKGGGYVTSGFNGTIMGARDTRAGSNAHAFWVTASGVWVNVSWGTTFQTFANPSLTGMYEGVRDVYGTNVTSGHYQGVLNTSLITNGVRNPVNYLYSLARNDSNGSITPTGSPVSINTTGFCQFEFHGSRFINSKRTIEAVTIYLKKLGFENLPNVW